jgi:hypothetical protein
VFFPRTERLDLTPERIRGLRISLNAPVIGLAGIPTGPARASILVHDESDGRPQVTIGIRSLRSGDVVVFSFEGEFGDDLPLEVGIDAALSFAESMGFLFDDDEVHGRDEGARERARGLWVELMGTPGPVADGPPAELFDHGDLSDLRPDDSFQLEERQQLPPLPGRLPPAAPPRPAGLELELAVAGSGAAEAAFEIRDLPGAEDEVDAVPAGARTIFDDESVAPADEPREERGRSSGRASLALSLHRDASGGEDLDLEIELDDAEPGADRESAAPAAEPFIDLAIEAVELGPLLESMEADDAPAPQEPAPPEPEPDPALESFDLDEAVRGLESAAPAPPIATSLLSKFRFAPEGDEATPRPPEGNGPASEAARDCAASDASAAARAAEAQAALARTALGRVRLVKRRAGSGEGSVRLHPVARLLTSF